MVISRGNFDDVGATVEKSAEYGSDRERTYTKLSPAKPRIIRFISRVVHPPASGVPAARY